LQTISKFAIENVHDSQNGISSYLILILVTRNQYFVFKIKQDDVPFL